MTTEQPADTRPLLDFADIADLMDQIATTHELYDGTVLVALVHDPDSTQKIVRIDRVPAGAYADDAVADEQMNDILTALPVEECDEFRYRTLTIVAHRGFTVMGDIDLRWSNALKYGAKPAGCFTTAQVIVTEHGWLDFMSGKAGRTPAIVTSQPDHRSPSRCRNR